MIHINQKAARECYVASLRIYPTSQGRKEGKPQECLRERTPGREHLVVVVDLDPRIDDIWVEPSKEVCVIPLKDSEHTTKIGVSLSEDQNEKLIGPLHANVNMFAWTTTDMSGIDPNIIVHKLSICKEAKPVEQKN